MVLDAQFMQAVPKAEFDPTALTGSWQAMNGSGFSESIKIWKIYNPSTTISIEISFDGVTAHDFIPPLGTMIVDCQTNHSAAQTHGTGTLNLRRYQVLYGRTATNPTYLQMIGFY